MDGVEKIKVSVIVVSIGQGKFISECLEIILSQQAYFKLEVVVESVCSVALKGAQDVY